MHVTRRNFLATATAAAAAPIFLGATDKAASKAPILGQGEHQYEAIHDWGELPRTIKYGNTHGVCEDSQGNIYVHHTVNATSDSLDTMVVFDHKGKFVRSWGRQFKGGAHGLTIRKEGSEEFLYLCDYEHGIVTKRTLKGEEVFTLGYPAESPAYKPKDQSFRGRLPANQCGYRSERRYLRRRWVRLELHQSIQPEGRVHTDIWRIGQRRRPDRLSSRPLGRHAQRDAASGGD